LRYEVTATPDGRVAVTHRSEGHAALHAFRDTLAQPSIQDRWRDVMTASMVRNLYEVKGRRASQGALEYHAPRTSQLAEEFSEQLAQAAAATPQNLFGRYFPRTQPSVCVARTLLYLIGKRGKSQGYFSVEFIGGQPAQLDDLVLNQDQPLDVSSHDERLPLANPQISGRLLAAIADDVVGDLGTLAQVVQPGLLKSRDMDEHVLAATAVRLNETITFIRVKPLHSTCRHVRTPLFKHGDNLRSFAGRTARRKPPSWPGGFVEEESPD
jgi:hypothetical protein